MRLTHGEVVELLKIIDEFGVGEFSLELGELRLRVVKGRVAGSAADEERAFPLPKVTASSVSEAPVKRLPEGAPQASQADASRANGSISVVAPMIGTFYRAPSPTAPPFVEPGQLVEPETPVGIVEVMKLMNTICAGARGRVVEVCVPNATLVEYGQVLMRLEPPEHADA